MRSLSRTLRAPGQPTGYTRANIAAPLIYPSCRIALVRRPSNFIAAASNPSDYAPAPKKAEPIQQEQEPGKEPEGSGPLVKLIKLLSKYEATKWLAGVAQKLIAAGTANERVGRIARGIFLLAVICIAAMFREASAQNARARPREVRRGRHRYA